MKKPQAVLSRKSTWGGCRGCRTTPSEKSPGESVCFTTTPSRKTSRVTPKGRWLCTRASVTLSPQPRWGTRKQTGSTKPLIPVRAKRTVLRQLPKKLSVEPPRFILGLGSSSITKVVYRTLSIIRLVVYLLEQKVWLPNLRRILQIGQITATCEHTLFRRVNHLVGHKVHLGITNVSAKFPPVGSNWKTLRSLSGAQMVVGYASRAAWRSRTLRILPARASCRSAVTRVKT